MTDKQRVLKVLVKNNGELTTAKIAAKAGVLHPSTRRYLNELRSEGSVQRGATHGTWIAGAAPVEVVEPVTEVVSAPVLTEAVPAELDVNARPELHWYKLSCEGDEVFAQATDTSDAFQQLRSATDDELPRDIVTIEQLADDFEVPVGASIVGDGMLIEVEPATDDEPVEPVDGGSGEGQ